MTPTKSHDDARVATTMFRAFSSRNFRLYFAGQVVSLTGTWMQMVAMSWLVYRLTDSALMLGVMGFASQIPTFVLAPVAGVAADRWNRRKVMIVTQALAMIQAFLLAYLVLTKTASVWHVLPLSVFLGIVNAFDAPARQALNVDMVERKEDLGNAIALGVIMFNLARLLGPTAAGLLIAVIGEAGCFFLNGLSFLAVIAALAAMRIAPTKKPARQAHPWQELKEGAAYAFGFAPIRLILLFLALVSLASMPWQTLLPVMAKEVLHGDASTLGVLVGASGVGSLLGGLYLAQRRDILGLEKRTATAAGLAGASAIALAFIRTLWLALPLAVVVGLGMMVQTASSNTIIQTIVEDDKRGRVMAFFTMAFMGMMPFGSLLGGAVANKIGAPNTFVLSGAVMIAGTVVFATQLGTWRESAHPVYEAIGVIRVGAAGSVPVLEPGDPADENGDG